MSEQLPQPPAETAQQPVPPAKPVHANPLASLIARLSLTQLTLIVLVALFVWQWLDAHSQLNQTERQVAQRLSEVEAAIKASQMLVAQSQEQVRELGGKLSLLESRYAETQNQRAALEALYQDMSSNRDQTALAEVEQMLLIAVQQLQLSANVKAALIAMQQADSRLQALERPVFASLRKRISQDIEKLRALPSIEAPAINQRLDAMISAVDGLPLLQEVRVTAQHAAAVPPSQDGGAWTRFWREVRQEAASLVRIENTGQQELPLLSPTQAFFLRENLKLRLLSARMALLTRDEVSFRRDLKMAQEWLKRYFDIRSGDGAQQLSLLQKLSASSIVIEIPDLSGSLEAVRNYRAAQERSTR